MTSQKHLPGPLEGVTVLDMTIALAGPYATLLLAALGARVIKIENPAGGDTSRGNAPFWGPDGFSLVRQSSDDISLAVLNRHRNKESVTLNLKHPEAREVMRDLIAKSDVVIDNFSRGVLDRLGVGYEFGRKVNPKIVYCSITGFGLGDLAGNGKAMDTIIQALSGVMMTSGSPDDPPVRIGFPLADMGAPLFAVIGVVCAILQARTLGIGQQVDVSMLGALTSMIAVEPYKVMEDLGIPTRTDHTVPRLAPFGVFPTSDGYVAICAPTDAFAQRLLDEMLVTDETLKERFATRGGRVASDVEIHDLVQSWTSSHTKAEIIEKLDSAGVPSAEVRGPDEAVCDPRVLERGETTVLQHPTLRKKETVYGMGLPIHFSEATTGLNRNAPELGEQNDAVYGELLGYSADRIAKLRSDKVI